MGLLVYGGWCLESKVGVSGHRHPYGLLPYHASSVAVKEVLCS